MSSDLKLQQIEKAYLQAERVTSRIEELKTLIHKQSGIKPLIHPAMASRYHQSVKKLKQSLNADGARCEAAEHLRALVEKIV